MNLKKVLFILFGMFLGINCDIVAQSKWHTSTSIGLNHRLTKAKLIFYGSNTPAKTLSAGKGLGYCIDVNISYNFFNRFSGGAGIAQNSIKISDNDLAGSLPAYLTLNYDILNGQTYPFAFIDYGYALPYVESLIGGQYLGFGVGYKFKSGFKFQIQAIQQKIKDLLADRKERDIPTPFVHLGNIRFNNIAFKIGYVFN